MELDQIKLLKYYLALPVIGILMMVFLNMLLGTTPLLTDIAALGSLVIVFTLPALISKVLLNRGFVSLWSATGFLVYWLIYLVVAVVFQNNPTGLSQVYNFIAAAAAIAWFALALKYIIFLPENKFVPLAKDLIIIGVITCVCLVVFLLLRQYSSILSTDFLVHQSAVNTMLKADRICLVPSECSNLFLVDGYVTTYHSIIVLLEAGFKIPIVQLGHYLELFASIIFSISIFYFLRQNGVKDRTTLAFATFSSLLIFDNLSLTFQFILPQTLAFLFLLYILCERKLTVFVCFIGSIVLLLTHFVMGAYLAALLWFYLIYNLDFGSKLARNRVRGAVVLIALYTAVFSYIGLSIEKLFQQDTLTTIGGLSNPTFAGKLVTIAQLFGPALIIFALGVASYLVRTKKNRASFYAFWALFWGMIVYFLAPTYAGKFFIGFGLFACILAFEYISSVRSKTVQTLLTVVLIFSLTTGFIAQYTSLFPFATQTDGTISQVVQKDGAFLNFARNNLQNCLVISDPQTQLELAALLGIQTANGHYIELPVRKVLDEFISTPNSSTFTKLYNLFDDIDTKNNTTKKCFVYSSRLHDLASRDSNWENNIYTYQVDHQNYLQANDPVISFFTNRNTTKVFADNYFQVYFLN